MKFELFADVVPKTAENFRYGVWCMWLGAGWYIHTHVHIYIYIFICVLLYSYIYIFMGFMSTLISRHLWVYGHVHTNAYVFSCVCVCIDIYIYIHTYVCICIQTFQHVVSHAQHLRYVEIRKEAVFIHTHTRIPTNICAC